MAGNNSDGSITIDTELDNDGFEKGSKKLLSAIEDLTGAVDNLGDNMMRSFQQVIPLLQSIANSASSTYQLMASEGQQVADTNDRIVASQQSVMSSAQKATQAVQQQAEAAKNVSGSMTNISASAKDASAGTDAAGKSVDAYQKQIDRTQAKIDTLKTKLADYYASAEQIQNPPENEDWLRGVEDPEQIARALEVEALAMESLNKKYATQLTQLKNLEAELARLKALQQEAANAPKELSDSAAVKSFASEVGKTESKLASYQAKVEKMQTMGAKSSSWKNVQYDIDATKAKLDEYKTKLDQLNASGGISTESYEKLSETLARLTETQSNLSSLTASMTQTSAAGNRVNVFLGSFGTALKSAGRSALSLAKNMARMPFSAMKAGLKAVTSRLKEFISHSKKTELSAKGLVKTLTSLKTVLVGRIKRMFISSIFSQMKEALNQLATFSGAFNQSVSNIKNNATQLSANLATLMGRLIVAIEPVLTAIISAVSTAMSYLNAFFAMLGGKTTMVVAKKQTASYADSLNDAAQGAKELKSQLMGFDEINRMEKNDSSGSGGSGGDLFEEVPIDSVLPAEVAAYFEQLKAAIAAGDWEGVGKIIADGLNSGMAVIDNWINTILRPMGVKWSEQVARILNGLTSGFNWPLLGQTLADGMNAAFDILNTFLTTYNFESLGQGIGAAIYSWFDNVEWELIGQTFANKWNALIDTIHGIVTTPGIWMKIGTSIGAFINNLFMTLDYTTAAETFVAGFNGIFTALQNIVNVVDWDSIARSIYTGLNMIIHGIDWEAAGKALSDAVVSLLGVIGNVVANTDWYAFGRGIGQFLSSIDWMTIIGEVGEILWQAFSGMFAGLFSTSGGKVITALGIGLLAIKGVFSVGKFALSSAVSSWILGGTGKFSLLTKAASSLVGGLGKVLGAIGSVIFSPTGAIIAGIAVGVGLIIANWDKIKDAAGKVKDFLSEKWTQIKDTASTAWDGITSTLSGAWEGIKGKASSIWTGVKDTVSGAFTNTKDSLSNTAQVIGSNLSRAWSSVSSSATGMWDKIKSTATSKFTGAQTSLSGTAQLMQSTLSQKFSGMLGDATQKFEGIRSALDRASTNSNNVVVRQFSSMASSMIGKMSDAAWSIKNQGWSSVGSNICSGIQSGINSGWSWLSRTVSSLASSLLRSAKNALGIHSPSRLFRDEVGENVGLGWAEGIEGTAGTVLKTVANVAKSITANAEAKMPDLQYSGDTLLTGLDTVASKLSGVADIFQNITNMLTSLPTLSVPDISVGTVVPYRAKVEDAKSQNEDPTASVGGQMDIIDALQQMFELVIQAIENKDNSVVIGDDVIYNSYNRAKQRMSMIRGTT